MTIEALQDYIVKQESMFDEVSNLINIYIESALSEYDINLKKIEYNVIKESKDESEEKELKGEAADGLVGKIRKAIVKLIDAVKKFCMNIYTKVSEKINDAKTQAAIKRAEKLAAKNKKLANTKIEVENTEAKLKATDKALDKLQTISSKLDAGKDVAFEEIENVVADHKKEMKAVGGAALTVTLIAGIGLLAANKDKLLSWVKDMGSGNKANEYLGKNANDVIAAERARSKVKCETETANLLKTRASIIGNALTSVLEKIKGAINFKSKVPTPEVDSNVKDTINNTVDTVVKTAKSAHDNLTDHDKIAMFHTKENTSEVDYDAQILEELANDIFAEILAETTNIKDDDIEEVEEASNEDKIINSLIDEINAENEANEIVKEQEETEKLIDSLIEAQTEFYKEKEESVIDEDDKEIINMIDDIKSELNL